MAKHDHARHHGHGGELGPVQKETRVGEQIIDAVGDNAGAHGHWGHHGAPVVTGFRPRR